jgi:hypothetical protein
MTIIHWPALPWAKEKMVVQGEDGGGSKLLFGDEREPRGQMFDVMKVHEPNSLSGT